MIDPSEPKGTCDLTEEEVRRVVGEIVVRLTPHPEARVTSEALLIDDLAYHSLAMLELAFELEEAFGLKPLEGRVARRIRTVADVEEHALSELRAEGRVE
jgi:acyl carrier protein